MTFTCAANGTGTSTTIATSPSYWTIGGDASSNVLSHAIMIHAARGPERRRAHRLRRRCGNALGSIPHRNCDPCLSWVTTMADGDRKLFGTDGIRGVANLEPMTAEMALRLGQAVARNFRQDRRSGRIVIGKDTRLSGYMLESALPAGICR